MMWVSGLHVVDEGSGGVGQSMTQLLFNHENMSFRPSAHIKKPGTAVCACSPSAEKGDSSGFADGQDDGWLS